MTEINKLIEETERLLAAATQGELRLDPVASLMRHPMFALRAGPDGVRSCIVACELTEPDARLFAAAPAALRALIDEVKRLPSMNVVEVVDDSNIQSTKIMVKFNI